jgi:hypothetical protein
MSDFEGAIVPATDFSDDNGDADKTLRHALKAFEESESASDAQLVLTLLKDARLLVPVVAEIDSMEEGVEKDSHMQSVEYVNSDGRRALLAFTGTDSLYSWNPDARPIPRAAHIVAQSVLEGELDAMILDLHGPSTCVIEGPMLVRLAISSRHSEYLEMALDGACDSIEELDGVLSADWETSEAEITIFLEIEDHGSTLGHDIAAILQDPNIAVVLDRPLQVEIKQVQ